ncbi:hypothetical protein [Desulfonatronum parangueonense]
MKTEESKIEILPNLGISLLESMEKDTRNFSMQIIHNSIEESFYCEIPIFQYIKAEDFVATYIKLNKKDRRMVMHAFKKRYEHDIFLDKIHFEKEWLSHVKRLFMEEKKKSNGKLEKHHYDITIKYIEVYIDRLNIYVSSIRESKKAI